MLAKHSLVVGEISPFHQLTSILAKKKRMLATSHLFSSTSRTRLEWMLMGWFKNKHSQKPQKLTPLATRFVAEQDGPSERDLKARFVELFRAEPTVERAYLALAVHDDETGTHVTLAIRCSCKGDPSLISKLASIFSSMFGSHEHLDMIFIGEEDERTLRDVCAPFYRAIG